MAENTAGTSVATSTPGLDITDGQITTMSTQVAAHFNKRHDNVIRAIRNIGKEADADFYRLNFEEVIKEFSNGKGGIQQAPAYRITRDGFSLLAMGFTGKKALRWKLAYISAFSKMEAALLNNANRKTIPATLYTQALEIELREARSFALAQAGSQAMLLRKSEKKELVETVALMREAIQLRLALGYSAAI